MHIIYFMYQFLLMDFTGFPIYKVGNTLETRGDMQHKQTESD